MSAYYNEFDPFAAAWLRELIKRGLIADGEVDERSITDVHPDDLHGFNQCHFFAGIGGWSLALRLAGWSDTEPIWSGSCPCQPFANAGLRLGVHDDRHLWPQLFRLIRERRPATIIGEQVASQIALEWLDGVFDDLEEANYSCAAADLCAASVTAPHIRQRIYWVANTPVEGMEKLVRVQARPTLESPRKTPTPLDARMGHSEWMELREGMGEPGLFPSSDGIPEIMGRLRGYGNAIVPQVAAHFIAAFMEARP